jgi:hypothetical protein
MNGRAFLAIATEYTLEVLTLIFMHYNTCCVGPETD